MNARQELNSNRASFSSKIVCVQFKFLLLSLLKTMTIRRMTPPSFDTADTGDDMTSLLDVHEAFRRWGIRYDLDIDPDDPRERYFR